MTAMQALALQALFWGSHVLFAVLQAQASRLERLEKIASGQLALLGDRASSD